MGESCRTGLSAKARVTDRTGTNDDDFDASVLRATAHERWLRLHPPHSVHPGTAFWGGDGALEVIAASTAQTTCSGSMFAFCITREAPRLQARCSSSARRCLVRMSRAAPGARYSVVRNSRKWEAAGQGQRWVTPDARTISSHAGMLFPPRRMNDRRSRIYDLRSFIPQRLAVESLPHAAPSQSYSCRRTIGRDTHRSPAS